VIAKAVGLAFASAVPFRNGMRRAAAKYRACMVVAQVTGQSHARSSPNPKRVQRQVSEAFVLTV
jgi:hypothetical protein